MSDEESRFIWDFFDPKVFAGVDLVISCGDLKRDYLEFVATLIPAPMYFVPGNHDKEFLTNPPGGLLPLDGFAVEYKGLRICGLGGCKSTNPYAVYEYSERVMARRVRKLKKQIAKLGGIDILATHAPAKGLGDGKDRLHEGFEVFRELLEEYKPRYYFYGHQHKCYGLSCAPEYYNGTRLINTCGYKIIDI